MKVSTTKTDGLYLKFFVLKMDELDAVAAAIYYADRIGNLKLLADIRKHQRLLLENLK